MTMTEGSKFQEQAETAKAKEWLKGELAASDPAKAVASVGLRRFGWALEEAIGGKRVRRSAWDSATWVCYMPPTQIHQDHVNTRTRKFIPEGPLNVQGYFVVYTKTPDAPNSVSSEGTFGKWQPGYVPSTEDTLATDWSTLD